LTCYRAVGKSQPRWVVAMNVSPLVTIAIPTHNRADSYFPQALQSALRQTYSNLEIIVSDNCSTDDTQGYVSRIGDPRVRYFRHEPGIGPNNNFNFSFEQAKGDYFSLLHDDDLIDDDFIEACMQAAQCAREAGIIRTGTRLIDSEGKIINELPNQASGLSTDAFFRGWFAGKTAIYLCSTLFNTEKLKEAGGFQSKHNCYQDTMAVMRLAAKYGRIDVTPVKASSRVHPREMAMNRKLSEWCEDSLMLLELMYDLATENKAEIRNEGLRFFAEANYSRASMKSSVIDRCINYLRVMRYFNCRHLPSPAVLLRTIHGTALHHTLRCVKRSWKGV
jgi:glycosyltransferase involved in cell wall biosynthesis